MAKLKPPNNTKMTKMHYEWLAWSIRQVESQRGMTALGQVSFINNEKYMTRLAEQWADQCKGTNPAFNRDRFISAVVNGEW